MKKETIIKPGNVPNVTHSYMTATEAKRKSKGKPFHLKPSLAKKAGY